MTNTANKHTMSTQPCRSDRQLIFCHAGDRSESSQTQLNRLACNVERKLWTSRSTFVCLLRFAVWDRHSLLLASENGYLSQLGRQAGRENLLLPSRGMHEELHEARVVETTCDGMLLPLPLRKILRYQISLVDPCGLGS